MAPELDGSLDVRDLIGKKYVRIGEDLVWDRPAPGHDMIVFMNRLPVNKDENSGKILVDDAGYIVFDDGKVRFEINTFQCQLVGNEEEENKKTNDMAREILGENKVK